jgi:hypothetical protein
MDAIINSISDASWWFTIIFSSIVAILLSKIVHHTPKAVKALLRNLIARRQRKIKNARFNQSLVNYQIARANSYFLIFVITFCLYLVWLISGPLLVIVKASPPLAVALSLPIYITEIIWLINDGHAKALAKARGKIA